MSPTDDETEAPYGPYPNLPGTRRQLESMGVVLQQLQTMGRDIGRLADHVGRQNHRLDKIEHQQIKEEGAAEERERWQKKEAANQKWFIGLMLTAAGVISGIVFELIQLL